MLCRRQVLVKLERIAAVCPPRSLPTNRLFLRLCGAPHNRKNSLFVGNERGGQTAAILSGLTSTCRRLNIDPQRYLTQMLTNLPATPISQIDQWLPDRWKLRNSALGG
jgi:IS66 C-terminal element